ncbi:MAG: DUF1653 domain-containing protein [Ruminococcaceae bacterium]|nr:DUF1653 domain-containing protein [Oscillospiraceae bacterium]
MKKTTISLGVYRHFKGNFYEALAVAKHSETMEDMVVYRALYGEGDIWGRPLSLWMEQVEQNGEKIPRFLYIGEKYE